jgi:hypothetical protein
MSLFQNKFPPERTTTRLSAAFVISVKRQQAGSIVLLSPYV